MDVLYAFIKSQELRALIEPTSPRADAATALFNLPDYRVTDTEILTSGQRRVSVEATAESGCPACGVISTRVHSRLFTVRGECSAVMNVHAAVLAALRNRIRVW
jgi:hypothetical protein